LGRGGARASRPVVARSSCETLAARGPFRAWSVLGVLRFPTRGIDGNPSGGPGRSTSTAGTRCVAAAHGGWTRNQLGVARTTGGCFNRNVSGRWAGFRRNCRQDERLPASAWRTPKKKGWPGLPKGSRNHPGRRTCRGRFGESREVDPGSVRKTLALGGQKLTTGGLWTGFRQTAASRRPGIQAADHASITSTLWA